MEFWAGWLRDQATLAWQAYPALCPSTLPSLRSMPGASGYRQHATDLQRRAAQAPRPSARGGTKPSNGQGRVAVADVAPAPVPGGAFSLVRAQAVQCIQGVKYAVGISEKKYWLSMLKSICEQLASAAATLPWPFDDLVRPRAEGLGA